MLRVLRIGHVTNVEVLTRIAATKILDNNHREIKFLEHIMKKECLENLKHTE